MFPRLNRRCFLSGASAVHIMCAALLLLVPLASAARGQGVGSSRGDVVGSTGGIHTITGRIYFPSGSASQPRVKVTLEGSNVTTRSTTTDANGQFLFTGLLPGTYTIIVDGGNDYETARESAYIETSQTTAGSIGRQDIRVAVTMRPKGSGSAGGGSSAFAGVPKPAVDLYNKALESSKKGDTKKAVEELQAAIAQYDKFAVAYNELGVQYLKLGQPAEAVEVLAKAIKLTPDNTIARLNYGIALMEKKDYAEAEKQLREVVKKNDNSPMGHLYLGITLLRERRNEEAEKELKRAVILGKDDVAIAHYYLGGLYWGKKDYKQAADELETYLKLVPNAPGADKLRATIKELRDKQKSGD